MSGTPSSSESFGSSPVPVPRPSARSRRASLRPDEDGDEPCDEQEEEEEEEGAFDDEEEARPW